MDLESTTLKEEDKLFLYNCEIKSKEKNPLFYVEDIKRIIKLSSEPYEHRKKIIPRWIPINNYVMEKILIKIIEKYSK